MLFKNPTLIFKDIFQKPHAVFLTLILAFGIPSAFMVPQLSANDESSHFYRSYDIASGDIKSSKSKLCSYPEPVVQKVSDSSIGVYRTDYKNNHSSTKINVGCTSANAYSIIMHIPQAIGITTAKLVSDSPSLMILFGRLTNLLFYAISLYYIIRFVRISKWVFVTIALFPIMVHTAASLSADVITNVSAIALIATIFNLFTQKTKITRKQYFLLVAVSIFVALTKSTNLIILLPLVFLPRERFSNKYNHKLIPLNIEKLVLLIGIGIFSIISIIIWSKLYGAAPVDLTAKSAVSDNPFYFLTILENTYLDPFIGYNDIVFRGTIGEFSSFKYHLPTFAVVSGYLILFSTLLYHKQPKQQNMSVRLWGASILAALLNIFAVSYIMYSSWAVRPDRLGPNAIYADGVQGRYFTVLLLLLIPLFIRLSSVVRLNVSTEKVFGAYVFVACSVMLLFYTIQTYFFIR